MSGSATLVVAQLALPPGSCQVIAKGVLIDNSQVEMAIACSLHTGTWDPEAGDGLDYASLTLLPASGVPVTLVGSFANTTFGDVTIAMHDHRRRPTFGGADHPGRPRCSFR